MPDTQPVFFNRNASTKSAVMRLGTLALIITLTATAGYFVTTVTSPDLQHQATATAAAVPKRTESGGKFVSPETDKSTNSAPAVAISELAEDIHGEEFTFDDFVEDNDTPNDAAAGDSGISENDANFLRQNQDVSIGLNIALTQNALADPLEHLPKDLQHLANEAVALEVSYDVGGVPATTSVNLDGQENSELLATIASAVELYNARMTERSGSVVPVSAANYRLTTLVLPAGVSNLPAPTVADEP